MIFNREFKAGFVYHNYKSNNDLDLIYVLLPGHVRIVKSSHRC